MENNYSFACKNISQSHNYGASLFLQIILILEMIVGLPGSVIALWIFWFRLKVWKVHILFLFNLVLADFLLLLSVPLRIDTHIRGDDWVHGPVWCTINLFMLTVNRSASIAFMTVVALDRYFKVVHPHHWISRITSTQACWISGLMWVAVILFRIPLLTTKLLHPDGNVSICCSFCAHTNITLAKKMHFITFIAEFFLPWLLLLFCSVQIVFNLRQHKIGNRKRLLKAIRTVTVINLVFTFCFMPSVVTGLLGICYKAFHPDRFCKSYPWISQLFLICIGFTYLNSALDPIVYCFSSSMFRAVIKKSIRWRKNDQPGHRC